MSEWQPIETAPKDGTRVVLFQPKNDGKGYIACASWDSYWQWVERGADYATELTGVGELHPTHWQPLPEPPPPPQPA